MVDHADRNWPHYVKFGARLGNSFNSYMDRTPMEFLEGGTGTTGLPQFLKAMGKEQVLPVCMMLTHRGNAPYNDNLRTYQTMYPFVKEHMHPLVVISSVATRESNQEAWFAAEDVLLASDVPVRILFEPSGLFADEFLRHIPEYVGLNRSNTVVWDAQLDDDYAYWQMLSDR